MINLFDGKTLLITGGTGSFGAEFAKECLGKASPKKVIIFSRDELKQKKLRAKLNDDHRLRFFLGDVRDSDRLEFACAGVDIIIHAAALKHVDACEYNPFECVKTNILGAQNLINASVKNKVEKVIALSTDKAASPANIYGASKLASDKLFVAANNWRGASKTKFAVVRYGNVFGSSGSVVPMFLDLRDSGVLPVTDLRMTRFSITLSEGVSFVLSCLDRMRGGELFVPKIPSYRITDLVEAIGPQCSMQIGGLRAGEKLHEEMITEVDSMSTIEYEKFYAIIPQSEYIGYSIDEYLAMFPGGQRVKENFVYRSDSNVWFLSIDELKKHVDGFIANA